jgi:tetratricopeptide (TPR) repeat protein
VRISELSEEGDPARRASLRLVQQGLSADASSQRSRAVGHYERAVQIDPTNPWVYLAMARHYARRDPERALEYLGQAEVLLDTEGALSPRVEPHLLGLRGEALRSSGRDAEGASLVAEAQSRAPSIWSDGHLSASELQ